MINQTLRQDFLDYFKKNGLKQGQILDPGKLDEFTSRYRDKKSDLGDVIDDLINKGLILEKRSLGKPSFALTKHGEDVLYTK